VFALFLADVLTGRIDRPPGNKKTNFSQDFEIIGEVINTFQRLFDLDQ
jgi:hypothetical protein